MINLGNTILNSILGGLLMGLSATLNLNYQGKITGISGILFKCLSNSDFRYNFSFINGMLFISILIKCIITTIATPPQDNLTNPVFLESATEYTQDLSLFGFILSGFIVGFGAKMANGCTSGHGICGLPRLSRRSIVAVLLFIIFGSITASIKYYIPFLRPISVPYQNWNISVLNYIFLVLCFISFLNSIYQAYQEGRRGSISEVICGFFIGALFSIGLIQSGMVKRHVVLSFLTIGKIWKSQLIFVMASAIILNFFTFNYILNKGRPRYKEKFDFPTKIDVDKKLVVGAGIFGIGWGLGGICPGPALIGLFLYSPQALCFFVFLCIGMTVEYCFDTKINERMISNTNLIIQQRKVKIVQIE